MNSWNQITNFSQALKELLEKLEGKHSAPYDDGTGRVTIGVGFNIMEAGVRREVFAGLGLDVKQQIMLTAAQRTVEESYIARLTTAIQQKKLGDLDTIMAQRASDSSLGGTSLQRRTSFVFQSDTEITTILNALLPIYDAKIWRDISQALQNNSQFANSSEHLALLSLAFNQQDVVGKKLLGPALASAINNGNRAEAWYEIRYNSNNGTSLNAGIAKRRYYESELFGLYDGTGNPPAATLTEAQQVYRMFSFHRPDIERYEQRYGVDFDGNAGWDRINGRPPLGAANYDFNLSGAAAVDAIHDALAPAWTALFAELQRLYPTGMAGLAATDFSPVNVQLDPNRNAGDPVTTNIQDHQYYLDGRRFNSQGLEISTRDVLIGEGGRDTLIGGLGDDVLIGGEGDDIYIYRAGDGNDRIIDSDRKGRIFIYDANGQRELAVGPFFQQNPSGGTVWQSANGQIQITHNSPWRLVLADGATIELGEEFQDGDFGIDLIDAATSVDYTRTLQGDREWQDFFGDAVLEDGGSFAYVDAQGRDVYTVNHAVVPTDWLYAQPLAGEFVVEEESDTTVRIRLTRAPYRYHLADDLGNLITTDQVVAVPDRLYGSEGNDRILAGEGNDEVQTKGGADRVELGNGDDHAEGGEGADVLIGGSGHDYLFGDQLKGSASINFPE